MTAGDHIERSREQLTISSSLTGGEVGLCLSRAQVEATLSIAASLAVIARSMEHPR